jgi:hypothetical protein
MDAAISSFEDAARRRADVINVWLPRHTDN